MRSMLKKLPILTIIFLASCSDLRQIAFTNNNKQASQTTTPEQKEVKFLDNISTTPPNTEVATNSTKIENHTGTQSVKPKPEIIAKPEVINYKEYSSTSQSNIIPAVEKTSP